MRGGTADPAGVGNQSDAVLYGPKSFGKTRHWQLVQSKYRRAFTISRKSTVKVTLSFSSGSTTFYFASVRSLAYPLPE